MHSFAPGTGSYKLVELNGPCIFSYIQVINLVAHIQISPFPVRTAEVTERSSSRKKYQIYLIIPNATINQYNQ